MSKKTIVDFGANLGGIGQGYQFGGFAGALLGGMSASSSQVKQQAELNYQLRIQAEQLAYDPSGYLVGVDPATTGGDAAVAQSYALTTNGLYQFSSNQTLVYDAVASKAIAPAPHVETVERLPRVIEFEADSE